MSLTYKYSEDFKNAEKIGLQFLKICDNMYGEKSYDIAMPLISLVKIFLESGDKVKLLKYQEQLLKLAQTNREVYALVLEQMQTRAQSASISERKGNVTGLALVEPSDLDAIGDTQDLIILRRIKRLAAEEKPLEAVALCKDNLGKKILTDMELRVNMVTILLVSLHWKEAADELEIYFNSSGLDNNQAEQGEEDVLPADPKQMNMLQSLRSADQQIPTVKAELTNIYKKGADGIKLAKVLGYKKIAFQMKLLYGSKQSSSSSDISAIADLMGEGASENFMKMLKENAMVSGQCAAQTCGNVETIEGSFKSCGRCKQVVYCSRECQVADWKLHKRISCISKKK
jgi:hypothetical protein